MLSKLRKRYWKLSRALWKIKKVIPWKILWNNCLLVFSKPHCHCSPTSLPHSYTLMVSLTSLGIWVVTSNEMPGCFFQSQVCCNLQLWPSLSPSLPPRLIKIFIAKQHCWQVKPQGGNLIFYSVVKKFCLKKNHLYEKRISNFQSSHHFFPSGLCARQGYPQGVNKKNKLAAITFFTIISDTRLSCLLANPTGKYCLFFSASFLHFGLMDNMIEIMFIKTKILSVSKIPHK